MAYSKVNYTDVPAFEQDKEALYDESEPVEDAMHPMAEALDCESLEVTIAKANPGWRAAEHAHPDPPLEEVYVLLDGEATVTVDGEAVELESGDAIRIDAESRRSIESNTECTWVLLAAPE